MMIRSAALSFHHRAVSLPRSDLVARALARQLGRADSILDVGAGDGRVGARVAELVGATEVYGVDVQIHAEPQFEVERFDGQHLPFADGAFDAVMLSDVLHHAERAGPLLEEAMRVARHAVAVKDHFRFGTFSSAMLLAMDVVGNARSGVLVRGNYLSPAEWVRLVRSAGGRIASLQWPLRVHRPPFSWMTSSSWQFAARLEWS